MFKDNGNGTITDNNTGVMWEKGPGEQLRWEAAVGRCERLELGGYQDWRLPRVEELVTILNYGHCDPACDPLFEAVPFSYWTLSRYAHNEAFVWVVGFGGGYVLAEERDYNLFYARGVRG